jgi:hypothetical protein
MTTVASGFRQRGTGPAGTVGHHLTTCTRAHAEEPQCEERNRVDRAPDTPASGCIAGCDCLRFQPSSD